jgi:hypothetical protein
VYDKEVGIAPGPGNFETKKMEDIYRRGIIQSFQNIRKYYNAGDISKDDAQAQYTYLHEKTLSLLMSRLAGVWTRDKHETLLPFQLARDGAGMTFQDSNNMNYLKTLAYKQHVEKDFKTFINGGMVPSTVIHDTHKKANDIFQNP